MIEKEQIILNRDEGIINAAKDYYLLNNNILILILKIFSFCGLFSFFPVFSEFLFDVSFGALSPIFRIGFFIGINSFFFLMFILIYFRDLEDRNIIPEGTEEYDVFKTSNLEAVKILGKADLLNPDLARIFIDVTNSSRVRFILREMNAGADFVQAVASSFPNDRNSRELLIEALCFAMENAQKEDAKSLNAGDLFFGFLKISSNLENILMQLDLSEEDVLNIVFWENNVFKRIGRPKTLIEKIKASGAGVAQNWASGYTLTLDQYSVDIANPRQFGSFSIEGRDRIIKQVENILSKDVKNNCILTGQSGTGKTTLVYGIAERIFWGNTLKELSYKKVAKLDTSALLAGASNSREAEARLITILNEAVRAGNIILFIDNIEVLFSGGEKIGTIDASEILNPYLQSANIRIIGTTSEKNYQTYIQSKSSLAGNFVKIDVPPTDERQTLRILEDLSLYYSSKYKICITYNALKEIYRLSEKYVTTKDFPAKAVDMLDNICAAVRNTGSKVLEKCITDSLVEQILNIPLSAAAEGSEKEKLLNLEDKIHDRVIGQFEAVVAVSNALRRARAQVTNNKRPIGSFLFLGPTGVGKTELTKALADVYFGSENAMVRMDMSEYQDISSIDRFIGRKLPGIDQLEGGDFVKKIRENPFSVVLLDELEKAHPDILNLFLQVLDEGYVTDGMGEKVIFTNTIIIATSNAGANMIREGIESGLETSQLKENLLDYLQTQNIYRSEFLNRFDGVIVFKPLTKENLMQIAQLMFEKIKSDFKKKGYVVDVEPGVLHKLSEMGYEPEFGARPMRRVFQDVLESFLANKILEGQIQKGTSFTVNLIDIEKTSTLYRK